MQGFIVGGGGWKCYWLYTSVHLSVIICHAWYGGGMWHGVLANTLVPSIIIMAQWILHMHVPNSPLAVADVQCIASVANSHLVKGCAWILTTTSWCIRSKLCCARTSPCAGSHNISINFKPRIARVGSIVPNGETSSCDHTIWRFWGSTAHGCNSQELCIILVSCCASLLQSRIYFALINSTHN